MFTEHLKKIVDRVGGGVGAVIMGLDGIAVETYVRERDGFDINIIGMEFSFILGQVKKAAKILHAPPSIEIGAVEEAVIKAEQLTLVIRMLNDDYFLAVALMPSGNFGKCRFLLRLTAPQIISELGR
ncbi:MAG: roadblock/LC7 domain-containing protein [Proteobacteria bacterium]|nr:roadblock/LC7 domain-containing protein [Pseudomonadota bacterium]